MLGNRVHGSGEQHIEELARHHVIWHEQEGNYEVQINRPGIVGRLGFPPDTAEWFAWLERIPSFRFHGKLGHFTAEARKPGSEAASTGSPIAMSKASSESTTSVCLRP